MLLGHDRYGRPRHTRSQVCEEMYLNICMHYKNLPDHRTLTASRIAFFYEGIRRMLLDMTKPK